jgi:transmembrane sensor
VKGTGQLDELILKVLDGEATPEEAEAVARWSEEAPENRARYEAVRRVWRATDPAPFPEGVDSSVVPRILRVAAEREAEATRVATPRLHPTRRLLRWALPLAAGIGAIGLGIHLWSPGPVPSMVLEATGGGSDTFVLDDGSFVRLAPGSRLTRAEGEDARQFELEGKALFAVAHVQDHPFVVVTDGVETRVLGTRFEVRALSGGDHRVAVLEGSVEVVNALGRAELVAGEVSVTTPDRPPYITTPDDLLGLLDWPEGTLLFQSTPLGQVAAEVARRYGTAVMVEGDALRGKRISAWFGEEPFADVIGSLCAATDAECTVSDTLAILR